ncbi:MAG: FtsX-like permease family protein [Steroidobacterales bacterium]
MPGPRTAIGVVRLWRMLLLSQLRDQPGRLALTVIAIALGVALGAAVSLVNGAALDEFSHATQRLVGSADLVVRGPRAGFPEALFVRLARDADVHVASPVLELEAAVPGRRETLKVIGLDPLRAGSLQVALIGDLGPRMLELFAPDTVFLSASAAATLRLRRGDRFQVIVGSQPKSLRVAGVLSPDTYRQPLALMDIASAQWTFERIGVLNRVDLRLAPGTDAGRFRQRLAAELPAGVLAVVPQVEIDRAVTLTRAYRTNLDLLALVALWTGAFLVFSTQSLSVLRRRRSFALLRALGVTRTELQWALVGEGAALGTIGALAGVLLGSLAAALLLQYLAADLGNGQLRVVGATLGAQPWVVAGFVLIGTAVASFGAWLPARAAAREAPARGLKGGDADTSGAVRSALRAGLALCAVGALLAWLPPVGGLPLFGYLSIAALLFGAVLLVPTLTVKALGAAPHSGRIVFDTAVAQLRDNVGLSALSLASVIVSFSLMVAMAIMVFSFRVSFDHWLGKLLPADIEVRAPYGNDTAFWSPAEQSRLAGVAGIERVRFRRMRPVLLDAARAPVTLIARDASGEALGEQLPLVQKNPAPLPPGAVAAYISESLQDLYGYACGAALDVALGAGHPQHLVVMGVWRDYARSTGSIVIDRASYIAASDDKGATDASIWLQHGADASAVQRAIRAVLSAAGALEVMTSSDVRTHSMQLFDRAFAITYALEAVAVLIGLAGVSFGASSTVLARRAEFGMLRHIGMLRRQILGLIADEGILTSLFGVFYGLSLGGILSLVLVFVVNRQSFGWSIDLAIPLRQLGAIGLILVAAAGLAATLSGRAALSEDAVRAVREDW